MPSFALAWTALARTWLERGTYYDKPGEAMPKALDAVKRALTLDPEQPDAHVVLGLLRLLYDWEWDDARRELTLGNTLRPQVVETFTCAAHLLQTAELMPFPTSSLVANRSVVLDIGGFDETLRLVQDLDFVARLATQGPILTVNQAQLVVQPCM